MWFSAIYRHSFQNPLLCIGKQLFNRSSGPETGEKKSASGEWLAPGHRGPRSPIYVMDVVKRNGTYPSGERPPGHRGPRISTNLTDVIKREPGLLASAPLSLPQLPGLASQPMRVEKQASLSEIPVAASTNKPVLDLTHVPVKPEAGQHKSAGPCFLPKAEEKTPVSAVRLPGLRGARSSKHLMDVPVKNIAYPSCESDLNDSASLYRVSNIPVRVDRLTSLRQQPAAVTTNMPVPVKAGQMSIPGERPPGHRGPSVMKGESGQQASASLSLPRLPGLAIQPVRVDKQASLSEIPVAVSTNMPVPMKAGQMSIPGERPQGHRGPSVMKGEPGQQASAPLSLLWLPSLASQPVRVEKRTSLSESPVAVSTNKPVLDLTHVPLKPEAGQHKSAGHCFLPKAEEKTPVSAVRLPGLRGAKSSRHFMDVPLKNITYPSCESDLNESASLYRVSNFPERVDTRTSLRRQPVAGERPPGHRGRRISTNLIDVIERGSDLQAIAPLSLPRVRVDKRTYLCEQPVSMNVSGLKISRSCEA